MGRARLPNYAEAVFAIERVYGFIDFTITGDFRRVYQRPSGGAYVAQGWIIEGYGTRLDGWEIAKDDAQPRYRQQTGRFLLLDDDL